MAAPNYQPGRASRPPRISISARLIVSCERADLRPLPNGVMIYQNGAARLDPLPPPAVPRVRSDRRALRRGRSAASAPLHDGAWAMATLEVCLAMLRSAREGREVALEHQVGAP